MLKHCSNSRYIHVNTQSKAKVKEAFQSSQLISKKKKHVHVHPYMYMYNGMHCVMCFCQLSRPTLSETVSISAVLIGRVLAYIFLHSETSKDQVPLVKSDLLEWQLL